MSQYADRDIIAQGEVYVKHVAAMTAEGLHEKSDIAAELAHRDIRIAELERQAAELRWERNLLKRDQEAGLEQIAELERLHAEAVELVKDEAERANKAERENAELREQLENAAMAVLDNTIGKPGPGPSE